MSSSDKLPDWSVFSVREAPLQVEMLSPSAEMAAVMQTLRADFDRAQQQSEETREQGLRALAEQAVLATQLAAALELYHSDLAPKIHRHLRVVKDQMMDALQRAGLQVVIPLGKAYNDVADSVHVVGWRHHEQYTAEVVAEVMEPIVSYGDTLVRQGKVVMGAPPEQEIAEPEAETESAKGRSTE